MAVQRIEERRTVERTSSATADRPNRGKSERAGQGIQRKKLRYRAKPCSALFSG
jgi:hypothetical protein